MVIGPIISLDDWVPERPPKNPLLRIPSPDLPPPPLPSNQVGDGVDTHISNQDDPLPPPPPELLRHMRQLSEPDTKSHPTSRRNSFAGSTNKKPLLRASTFDNLLPHQPQPQQPPAVPKKPTAIDMRSYGSPNQQYHPHHQQPQQQQPPRSSSSLAKHPTVMKPHKVMLNGKLEAPTQPIQPPTNGRQIDTRMSLRKRCHNAQLTPLELPSSVQKSSSAQQQQPPPPLKPRIPIIPPSGDHHLNNRSASAMGSRLR